MNPKLKFSYRIILSIVVFVGVIVLGIGRFPQLSTPEAIATAPGIPPELTKMDTKSYLLTWTDDSVVYVSCYPTVRPRMKPAPIQNTPNRYVITCKN